MQKLDHEYMLRPSEAPLLKKKPSDYMRDMFYSSQPMEIQDMGALECTFRMINAETQLMYSSDYPHWDFDLPSTISDLPFLTEKAKHNILAAPRLGCSSCRRATRRRKPTLRNSAISLPRLDLATRARNRRPRRKSRGLYSFALPTSPRHARPWAGHPRLFR